MNSYDPGDSIRLIGTFTNAGGTASDPTTVALYLVPPAVHGVVPGTTSYTYAQGSITRQALGSYTYDILSLPQGTPGVWQYSYVGSGAVNAVFVGAFNVYQGPRS